MKIFSKHRMLIAAIALGAAWLGSSVAADPPIATKTSWLGPKVVEKELPFYLGCKMTAPWNEASRRLGVQAATGATVLNVQPDSPGEKAGLRAGDLLVRAGDYDIESVEDLVAAFSLLPRGVPQPIEFVRGTARLKARLTIEDRTGAEALPWFTHPSGNYRFRVSTAWSVDPPKGNLEFVTILWDVILSAEKLYRVECYRRTEDAPQESRALDDFIALHRASTPGTKVVRTEIAGVPAAWIASYQGESPRVAVYQFGFCHRKKLHRMEFTAPAISSLETLPLPLRQILGTLQLAGDSPEGAPPLTQHPNSQADDKPPPGWQRVAAGDIRLDVPLKWEAVPDTRAGEGIWQLGDGETPRASVALVRNQPWENFAPRVESPQHRRDTIAGLQADVYEGAARGGPAGRVRVVILRAANPLADELTVVCFAREEAWEGCQSDLAQILASIRRIQESKSEP